MPTGPLFHKPKSILAARNILYATLFVESIRFVIQLFVGGQSINTLGHLSNLLLLILLYIAVRYIGFGKTWARNMFFILLIINFLAARNFIPFAVRTAPLLVYLFVLQLLLEILAAFLLFKKSSSDWFRDVKEKNS